MRVLCALVLSAASSTALAFLAAACGSSEDGPASAPLDGGGLPTKTDAQGGDASTPPGTPGRTYAHTVDTLYLFEPVSRDIKEIGKFSCLRKGEVVIDLAVDRTGNVYATTFNRFLTVDPNTASCTVIKEAEGGGTYPNALSFVPAGTLDPTTEALVGYAQSATDVEADDYVRIDTKTGEITKIGELNVADAGTQYFSSGDLFSLIQDSNRTFLSVRVLGDVGGTDRIAEVDPASGAIKRIVGDTMQRNIFGLGYWGGKGYGFSEDGRVSEIDMTTGVAVIVKTLTAVTGGSPLPWYGAGVTTEAPTTR